MSLFSILNKRITGTKKYTGRGLVVFCLAFFVLNPAHAAGNSIDSCNKALTGAIKSLNARSPAAFNQLIDANHIVDKSLQNLDLDANYKQAFSSGLHKGLGHIGERFLTMMTPGHEAKIIRVKKQNDVVLGLVRLDYGDSGWGYMDLWLKQDAYGRVRIVDWFNFASGELYSSSIRKVVVMTSRKPSLYGRIFDSVTGRNDDINVLSKYFVAIQKKRYDESYKIFKNMSPGLRKSRILGVIAVSTGNISGNNKYYKDALANLARYHGDDPTLAFLLIDHYFVTHDYDAAIRSLDSFQKYVGTDDAAIENLKANTLMKAGKTALAIKHATIGINMEPELESNYWTMFSIYTSSEKYVQAVAIGKVLEKRFRYDMGPASLGKVEEYRPFIKSVPYRKWHKS